MDRQNKMKPHSLQIAYWNANGLKTHQPELLDIVLELDLDNMLIQETHLKGGDKIQYPNYTTYITDRTQ